MSLTPGMVALHERTALRHQPESWSLVHPTETSTSEGTTTAWAVTASGTEALGTGARLMPAGTMAREAILASRPGAINARIIALPAGTDPRPQDRIIIGTALVVAAAVVWEVDGVAVYPKVFEVTGDSAGHTWESATKVEAVEID